MTEASDLLYYERKFSAMGKDLVIGIDEAGRGPLAGPVVAAAVILMTHSFANRIDDSKKLSAEQREKAFLELTAGKTIFGVGVISEQVIDRINIYQATCQAMHLACDNLLEQLDKKQLARVQAIVDGNMNLDLPVPCKAIVKGDGKSKSIAAASIIAKVTRDRIMLIYDKIFPGYGFARHKGYATDGHVTALKKLGRSLIHRTTFIYE